MVNTNNSNSPSEEFEPISKELVAIRQELEHLQDRSLGNIWEQVKDLKEQNTALLKEISLLKQSISGSVARGVILANIFLVIIVFLMSIYINIIF